MSFEGLLKAARDGEEKVFSLFLFCFLQVDGTSGKVRRLDVFAERTSQVYIKQIFLLQEVSPFGDRFSDVQRLLLEYFYEKLNLKNLNIFFTRISVLPFSILIFSRRRTRRLLLFNLLFNFDSPPPISYMPSYLNSPEFQFESDTDEAPCIL